MAITAAESRIRIVAELGAAAERLSLAVACLGEAFELLDDVTAERLESELFRPAQKAFGRAKRTGAGFAERFGLAAPELESPSPGVPSQGVKAFVERAVAAAAEGDHLIAELQDSMLPIEAGDAELRAGLAEVRALLAPLATDARGFLRTLGR